jgi:hypothetical protein
LTTPLRLERIGDTLSKESVIMKNQSSKRLQVKRETLRELNPRDLSFARGGAQSDAGSDVSNCCCNPTSNQGQSCGGKPKI